MAKISVLLKKRERQYLSLTNIILNAASCVTEASGDFIRSLMNGTFAGETTIEWKSIIPIGDNIQFIGKLILDVGGTVTHEGETVEITEANQPYFQYPINVVLPSDIVDRGDKQEITRHLYEYQDEHAEVVYDEEPDVQDMEDEIFTTTVEEASTSMSLGKLSEEQKEKYDMFKYLTRSNKH